jgi:hypothetical protein
MPFSHQQSFTKSYQFCHIVVVIVPHIIIMATPSTTEDVAQMANSTVWASNEQ